MAQYGILTLRDGALEAPPPWEEKTMQRVGLFVDGANMFYAQRDNRWHIDWRLVFHFFTDTKEKAAAYYFTATPPVGVIGTRKRKGRRLLQVRWSHPAVCYLVSGFVRLDAYRYSGAH
jgi:hypothetical protein